MADHNTRSWFFVQVTKLSNELAKSEEVCADMKELLQVANLDLKLRNTISMNTSNTRVDVNYAEPIPTSIPIKYKVVIFLHFVLNSDCLWFYKILFPKLSIFTLQILQ